MALLQAMDLRNNEAVAEWRIGKPKKSHRRRIMCQPRQGGGDDVDCKYASHPPSGSVGSLPPLQPGRMMASSLPAVGPSSPVPRQQAQQMTSLPAPGKPFTATVRMLYFSRDGLPADTGEAHELAVTTETTVEALLEMVRKAAGVAKGRLLFRNKPMVDEQMTLGACGVLAEPKGLHLLLSRKHRPSAVAAAAEAEAAELRAAMVEAEAAAAARPKRQKRVFED